MARTEVYIGLGSNLGDRAGHLLDAAQALGKLGPGFQTSSVYETTPVGFSVQPTFYNAVCRFWTTLGPFELLATAGKIERDQGRHRTFVNAPRALDLDILYFGSLVLSSPVLSLPHPRLGEREFVLVPLAELAPVVRHPVTGETSMQMLGRVPRARARRIAAARTA